MLVADLYIMHEGKTLQKFAKISEGGINGLIEKLDISRTSMYYYFAKDKLDDEFKAKVAQLYLTNVNEIWQPPIPPHKKGLENIDFSQLKEVHPNLIYTERKDPLKPEPMRDADDLGAYHLDDAKEEYRGKEYIDLGNGKYIVFTELVPHIASTGYLLGYSDPTWLEELPKHAIVVDHIPKGTYRTFVARGESMFDGTDKSIAHGYKVTGRVVNKELWKYPLHIKKYKAFIIVHKEGITIKQITSHDVENGIITIHSLNPDKDKYPDRELWLGDVLQLLNVIKVEQDYSE